MASGQDESSLIERVFLRIGSAETDDQLQTALGKFLPPVLLKLTSSNESVRKKVMELLVHINKRVKSRAKVQLPVDTLLTQYQDPTASSFITNFTILYIKLGFPRMEPEKQAELIPLVISCLEGRPQTHQDSMLTLLIPALQHIKLPRDVEKRKIMFGLNDKPLTVRLILDYMMDILLLPYSAHIQKSSTPVAGTSSSGTLTPVQPGFSEQALKRVTGDNAFTPENLEKAKLGILNFLGADILPEHNVVCHLIVAASDTRHSIATNADMELKRIMSTIDWNDATVIGYLYSIFQGTMLVRGQVLFDCLYGANVNHKLKSMAVQFVHHICFSAIDVKLTPFAPVLLSGMVKLISESKEDPKIRSLAYVAVGKIVRRVPQLVSKDLSIVQTFFDAMCQEDPEMRLAVQEALALMSEAFKNLDEVNKKLMEALIMQNIDKPEPQARLIAVNYAIAVYATDHIPSRYVLLLACGDVKEDIRSEASKALKPVSSSEKSSRNLQESSPVKLPGFIDMMTCINEKATLRLTTQNKYVAGNNVLPFNPGTFSAVLSYLRLCMAASAGIELTQDNVTTLQDQAPKIAKYIKALLIENSSENGPVQRYINLIHQLLLVIGDESAMYCLLEAVAMVPDKLAPIFRSRLAWLKTFVYSSKEALRDSAAQLYATVVTNTADHKQVMTCAEECIAKLSDKSIEVQHGSMLTLGYLVGQMLRKKNVQVLESGDSEAMQIEDGLKQNMTTAVNTIASQLKATNPQITGAACSALGEIGCHAALPLPPGEESDNQEEITKWSIISTLLKMIRTSNETSKTKERAIICLGYLCVGEADFPHRKHVIKELMDAIQTKQLDLHFSISEALVHAAQGVTSPAARDVWIQSEEEFTVTVQDDSNDVEWYLKLLLQNYITSANPHVRQASCIWLLALVKKCGDHASLQAQLPSIQDAFMKLLSENDESTLIIDLKSAQDEINEYYNPTLTSENFDQYIWENTPEELVGQDITQDVASKGLGLVFEKCAPDQKNTLVSNLVETLMTGKRTSRPVTGDTEVFQEGALGKTPDGGSMSTYKELCSIANDLNQPDLIYKFMHLANHQAMWASRKGAAFGFTTIAAQAGEQLAPFLPKIVPKLYRYQFDPNPKIQQAMSSIWSALVHDNKQTVDTYLKEITDDVVKNLTSNQWRVRESSCTAVTDLVRGRQLSDIVDQLPLLWEKCLMVLDDIKESVRKAADMACKSLSKASIKICDLSNGPVGEQAIRHVLPCLLEKAMVSHVAEVRAIGLSTILKISKNAGVLLKPHIPILVTALLEAVSGLEPQVMNYLSLHAASSQETQEKLDMARIAASKSSPMMETVNFCVQYVDGSVLPELVPRLTELIKSGIGVGTKASCSSFIVSLVMQCPQELAPHAGRLMSALLTGLSDRNVSVRKSYASAMGHLVKVAKDSSVEKLILKLKSWYLEKEDESARQACGLCLNAISQYASDILKRHAALAMPLAFYAMHEKASVDSSKSRPDKNKEVWEEVWFEVTPGTEAGIRLYITEIMDILRLAMESQSWPTKAQAAVAMSTVASKLGGTLGPPHLGSLLTMLLNGLSGRTWTGKESLLQAICSVCTACKKSFLDTEKTIDGQPTLDQVLEAVLKECRKENWSYKMEALKCIGEILETHSVDRFKEVWDIVSPILKKEDKSDDDDDDDMDGDVKIRFQECGFETLGKSWPVDKDTQDTFQSPLCDLLCSRLSASTWKVQLVIVKAIYKVIDRLKILAEPKLLEENLPVGETLLNQLLEHIIPCLGNMKYAVIREEALTVIELIVTRITEDLGKNELLHANVMSDLEAGLSTLAEDNRSTLQDKAIDIRKKLAMLL